MQDYPLSVIVASFNYEVYIKKTLASLLAQTNDNFEIVVIDDGSRDNSLSVIESFKEKAPTRIKLLYHDNHSNLGLPASISCALSHCVGKYIAFCESDDFWRENHVEMLMTFLSECPQASFVVNKTKVINYSKNFAYEDFVYGSSVFLENNSGSIIAPQMLASNMIPTFSSVCVTKKLLSECDFNSYYPQYLDYWLWRQILLTTPVYYLSNVITYWRKHNRSYNETANVKDISKFLQASNKVLRKRNPRAFYYYILRQKFLNLLKFKF